MKETIDILVTLETQKATLHHKIRIRPELIDSSHNPAHIVLTEINRARRELRIAAGIPTKEPTTP